MIIPPLLYRKDDLINSEYSIKELNLKENFKLHIDSENTHSIIFATSGTFISHWKGKQLFLSQNDILIIQPQHKLTLQLGKKDSPSSIIWLQVTENYMTALSDQNTDLVKSFNLFPFGATIVPSDIQTLMLLKNLSKRLITSEQNPKFGHSIMINGIISIFLTLVLRLCILVDLHIPAKKQTPLMIDHVFIYIRDHLSEDLSLKHLEKVFFVSHEHISREFKKQSGQSLHSYINNLRLEQSCILLKEGLSVSQIWHRCGFNSYAYFFQAFRKKYNMTPKEYALNSNNKD